MFTRRHRLSPLLIALLAIAGMLSVGDAARACAEVKVTKACCEAAPSADCRCCDTSAPSAPLSGLSQAESLGFSEASATVGIGTSLPGSSCECRSNAPTAPAPKPESRNPDESRTDQGHDEVVAYLLDAPRPPALAYRLISANVSPPKSPLYLRTLHLLV